MIKDKIKLFFDKNYDYPIIIGLIVLSLVVSSILYYGVHINQESDIYFNLPCFIMEQDKFIERASLDANDILPPLDVGVLAKTIIENAIGIILILCMYYSGKIIFKKTGKNWLKIILKILAAFYFIIILSAAVIMPIVGCIIRFG